MKTAKEMFEELGYDYLNDTDYEGIFNPKGKRQKVYGGITEVENGKSIYVIMFGVDEKEISNFILYLDRENNKLGIKPYRLKFEELQAINKQIEELGWNNEEN